MFCLQDLPLSRDTLETPLNQVTPQNVVIRLRKGELYPATVFESVSIVFDAVII